MLQELQAGQVALEVVALVDTVEQHQQISLAAQELFTYGTKKE
jgi:hypothetical protein